VIVKQIATEGRAFDRRGLSLEGVVGFYILGAALVTIVIAVSSKWATSRARGAILGFFTAMMLLCVVNFTLAPEPALGRGLLVAMLVFGLFPGSLVGAMYWEPPKQ